MFTTLTLSQTSWVISLSPVEITVFNFFCLACSASVPITSSADDVIGTLAEQARQKKLNTVISTGDKDMTQLVCDNVSVVNTMSGELLDQNGVMKKFGVGPELITDYLALIGDKLIPYKC